MAEEQVEEEEPKFFYCESCGIQLKKTEDYGGKDINNKWCKNCCNADGSHKSREEMKKSIAKFFMSPDAYAVMGERVESEEEALKLAEEYMKKMPAWSTQKL